MVPPVFGIAFGGTVLALALALGSGARDLAPRARKARLHSRQVEAADRISQV